MNVNELLKNVNVQSVYRLLGRELPKPGSDGWAMIRCLHPDHRDEHPSCSVYVESGNWHCFSCLQKGDLIEAVGLVRVLRRLETR